MRHRHYSVIMAWAEGKKIQISEKSSNQWEDWNNNMSPRWYEEADYRIKPEPILDIVRDFYLESNPLVGLRFSQAHTPIDLRGREFGCIRCTFDGETQRLKKAEVI